MSDNDGNIVAFPATTTLRPEQALHSSLQHDLKDVIIIGIDENDELLIRSSAMSRKDALWLVKMAERHVFGAGSE